MINFLPLFGMYYFRIFFLSKYKFFPPTSKVGYFSSNSDQQATFFLRKFNHLLMQKFNISSQLIIFYFKSGVTIMSRKKNPTLPNLNSIYQIALRYLNSLIKGIQKEKIYWRPWVLLFINGGKIFIIKVHYKTLPFAMLHIKPKSWLKHWNLCD